MSANAELTDLTRKRGGFKRKLTNFVKYVEPVYNVFKTTPTFDDEVIIELQNRFAKLDVIYNEFDGIQSEIESACADDELDGHYAERDEFTDKYNKYYAIAKRMLKVNGYQISDNKSRSRSNSPSTHSSHSHSSCRHISSGSTVNNIKLPVIDLPKFQGNYDNWLTFKDTFESLIHLNDSINSIQKFHYLKASLEADALKIIQSLEFSAENYQTAWELLCNRYNNKRLLVNTHIKALFNLAPVAKDSATSIRSLIDNLFKHLRTLTVLGQPTEQWDPLLIFIVCSKLDRASACEWEKHNTTDQSPSLKEMQEFLRGRANLLESVDFNVKHKFNSTPGHKFKLKNDSSHVVAFSGKCNFCKKPHKIYTCKEFLQLSVDDRIAQVSELKLCKNCLCIGHEAESCKAGSCKVCKQKHNKLLHPKATDDKQVERAQPSVSSYVSHALENSYVMLSTICVYIYDNEGNRFMCNCLLDNGSQPNFISTSLARKLGLDEVPFNISINGVNNVNANVRSKCNVRLASMYNDFTLNLSCFVLPTITGCLPNVEVDISDWELPDNVPLADPKFNIPKQIDLLIGAGHFWRITKPGIVRLGKGMPVLQNTVFGYTVTGQINAPNLGKYCHVVINNNSSTNIECAIQNDLQKFWLLEEVDATSLLSNDEKQCEEYFRSTTTRNEEGRFVVRIPFKDDIQNLGDSKELAVKRFLSQENRFNKNEKLKTDYTMFMKEYQILGHMSTALETDSSKPTYFLPHHAVFKEDSLTSKIRVVFNGSAASTSGYSLNDLQHSGPVIQNCIVSILLRFRIHNYVVISDISKMYRQILVHPDDRQFQRIVWRDNPNNDLQVFNLNTVTYGTTSAPFLAIRCIKELANLFRIDCPVASKIISNDFYVDDLITGFSTREEAIKTCQEIITILKSAQFDLRKWRSNDRCILNELRNDNDPISVINFIDKNVKTLGIQWAMKSDSFSYHIAEITEIICTKRSIISEIAKLYDPLGLVSPCIIYAKILIQRLWCLRISWDEEVPCEIKVQWLTFRKKLNSLNQIKIPRHAVLVDYVYVQIHGFCDASERAYGACIYLRSENNDGVQVSLLCAKSRVAPLKTTTVPRLELCGALLLAKLIAKVIKSLDLPFECFLWTDSSVVLQWINTEPYRLQTFVGNRVTQIQEITSNYQWNHVSTKDNPADLVSRGALPQDIINNKLWWNGPHWLRYFEKSELVLKMPIPDGRIPELKGEKSVNSFTTSITPKSNIFERYSTLTKLKRVIAYCFRFYLNLRRSKESRLLGPLTVNELEVAMKRLIKLSQIESFATEYQYIKNDKLNKVKNKCKSLAPFIDNNKVIRVGGRLKNSDINFDAKHPYLLDSKHMLTKLIFKHEHEKLFHTGAQLLLNTIRQTFWPIGGLNLAKHIVRSCIVCTKYNPKPCKAFMGDLPKSRVSQLSPFSNTGIDYAGPFIIKDRKGRGSKTSKAYICLYVCFSTKAVHLELVSDLTTQNFISSLRRFVARRGYPSDIWSDNGTNFIGASRSLVELKSFLEMAQDSIVNFCSNLDVKWHFIPPNSPHFGGLWESNIKSVKKHLLKTIGTTILTYEEFLTVLVQVESVINSRPLHPISTDPNDLEVLTPSHFLIGKPLITPPDPNLLNVPVNRLLRYQLLQQLNQGFWKRWARDYLSQLQQRNKWMDKEHPISVGTMVLLKSEATPPAQWPLGRVLQLHPGSDNVCRVVSVKTNKGVFKRPIVKVCPLLLADTEQST